LEEAVAAAVVVWVWEAVTEALELAVNAALVIAALDKARHLVDEVVYREQVILQELSAAVKEEQQPVDAVLVQVELVPAVAAE
jgi:hypothetical protein